MSPSAPVGAVGAGGGGGAAWMRPLGRGAQAVAAGALLGGIVAAGSGAGLWPRVAAELGSAAGALHARVGPVWVAMLAVGLRVAWLASRAAVTRFGGGGQCTPVRPELMQLAPLFAALGLCGTVWGLTTAFDALQYGDFLTQLPVLLGGLGAAMTSTLAGLGLQIVTLLVAAFNPVWSRARVSQHAGRTRFSLDARSLGEDVSGFAAFAEAIDARRPEALRLEFASDLPDETRERVLSELWRRIDGVIPIRSARMTPASEAGERR